MNQKEKSFMMISNQKNISGLHGLYKIIRRSKGYAEKELSPMSKLG